MQQPPLTALLLAALCVLGVAQPSFAQAPLSTLGVVVMHGKGGSPTGLVAGLAASLQEQGALVSNREMPWSGNRQYDVDVAAAEKEVDAALEDLRAKGARRLFVVGHSLGGLFALHYAGKGRVDGVVAIAPAGSAGSRILQEQLGASVQRARELVAEGKGGDKARLDDFETSRGRYVVITAPAAYLSWFDPEGAMNQVRASKRLDRRVPVLFIVPTDDYPALVRIKQQVFALLPRNPLTRLYEPDASHAGAPTASRDEIARWMAEVAGRP